MKVIVAGGNNEADFIIKMLKESNKNEIVVINSSASISKKLSESNEINVLIGDPTKEYTYESIEVNNYDIFISLSDNDSDNYVACKIAKSILNVKKVICIVKNPKNVSIFESLGIDRAISSTYLLSQTVKQETSLDDIFKTLALENEKIKITEVKINKGFLIIGKALMDIKFPANMTVGCIFRNPHVIIPKGNTIIKENDKLLIISDSINQKEVVKFVMGVLKEDE